MGHTMERKVEQADGFISYTVAAAAMFFALFLANSPVIMAVGGFIVLCMRLYVDGKRFVRELRRKKEQDHDD